MFFWNKSKPTNSEQFLTWTPDLMVGVQQYDREHQHLGSLINQLHKVMVVQRDRLGADQLIDKLIQIARAHFASEEAILTELDFSDREAHFQEHSKLIQEILDLQRQFRSGNLSAMALPTFLRKWLLEHIQNSDMQYSEFLRSKGIS